MLALGQAYAKQKLQGEEILQLTERGVPVWDLLAKATGKNVIELQKLSEQGKLGRDVIAALITEIGKANAGAAAGGLGSLSGLMGQVSARWTEFKQKVVDAGLGDYFRTEMQSLLASTGGLDGIARRVSAAIVGAIDAAKNLARSLAPIGAVVLEVSIALARHAEAIVNVAKAYVLLRVTDAVVGFTRLTLAVNSATTAMVAQSAAASRLAGSAKGFTGFGAAATAAGAAVERFGARLHLVLSRALIPTAVIASVYALGKAYEEVTAIQQRLETIEALGRARQANSVRVGQQLQQLYAQYAGTAIASAEQLRAKTSEQVREYQLALTAAKQYYQGVIKEVVHSNRTVDQVTRDRLQSINAALQATQTRISELSRTAAAEQGVARYVVKVSEAFDRLVAKGKSATEAISGAFKSLDLGSNQGAEKAIALLEQIGVRGKAAGDAVRAELRTALAGLSDADLPRVAAAAKAALGGGAEAAKLFASEVNRINLTKLGVDVEAIQTGFTAVGRAAVDQFKGAVKEIDRLGLTAQQRSTAIAQAFDNAFKQASTKSELEALRKALQAALATGDVGFQEFQARIAETDAKLAALAGTAAAVGQGAGQGAAAASAALGTVAAAAEGTAGAVGSAGDATQRAGAKMQEASKAGEAFALTMYSVSDAATAAYSQVTRSQSGFVDITGRFARDMNRITGQINEQGQAIEDQIAKIDQLNQAFDETADRRAQLRSQYELLGDAEINRLIDKERELARNQQAAADRRRQAAEEQRRVEEEAAKAARDRIAATSAEPAAPRAAAPLAPAPEPISTPAISGGGPLRIQLESVGGRNGESFLTKGDLRDLATEITALVVRELEFRARSSVR